MPASSSALVQTAAQCPAAENIVKSADAARQARLAVLRAQIEALEAGHEIKVGRFPFMASGKAQAAGDAESLVKLIFDARYGEVLGAAMIGAEATELIAEVCLGRKLEATYEELLHTVHAHPTLSEAVMEAAGEAFDEAINL